jgi:hypothetical protein
MQNVFDLADNLGVDKVVISALPLKKALHTEVNMDKMDGT